MNIKCGICKKIFIIKPYRKNTAKYCSLYCYYLSKHGQAPWNKGKKFKKSFRISPITDKERKNISERMKKNNPMKNSEIVAMVSKALLGKKLSRETIIKLEGKRAWNKNLIGYMSGEKHWNWQGGISGKNKHIEDYQKRKKNAIGRFTPREWQELKEEYNYMCLCCKKNEPEIKLVSDHIIPLSRNGSNYIKNIQPLCISCNSRKYNKIINYKIKNEISIFNRTGR